MKKILLFIAMFIFANQFTNAQTSLNAGDIAFVALNSDGMIDDFSFVLLKDVTAGTEIKFTDQGWIDGFGFNNTTGDFGHFIWTANSSLSIGTIVTIITDNGNSTPVATTGTCVGNTMLISSIGDQILAFQGTFDINANFIAGIHYNLVGGTTSGANWDGNSTSNSTSALPNTLINGDTAIWVYNTSLNTEMDNMIYNCSVTSGDASVVRAAINNVNNWSYNTNSVFTQNPFPCSFSPTLSVSDLFKSSLNLFPNPTSGEITVQLGQQYNNINVKIVNVLGQTVKTIKSRLTNKVAFEINQASGIYFIEVTNDLGEKAAFKVIKE